MWFIFSLFCCVFCCENWGCGIELGVSWWILSSMVRWCRWIIGGCVLGFGGFECNLLTCLCKFVELRLFGGGFNSLSWVDFVCRRAYLNYLEVLCFLDLNLLIVWLWFCGLKCLSWVDLISVRVYSNYLGVGLGLGVLLVFCWFKLKPFSSFYRF